MGRNTYNISSTKYRFHGYRFFLLSALLLSGLMVQYVYAGPSAIGQAEAIIIPPLTVHEEETLQFGQIRSSKTQSGTVVITPQNVRFATGGASLAAVNNQNNIFHQRAEFQVDGPTNNAFTYTLSANTAEHDNGSSNPNLQITDPIGFSVNLGLEGLQGELGNDGKDTIYVGATLQVPSKAKNGKYEGEIIIMVDY